MKILFFIDTMTSGGKERRLTELMKALFLTSDVEFELVVMSYNFHYQEVLDLNIPIHYLIRKSKKDLSVFQKFYKLCRSIKPDLVHCWDSMTVVYSVPICKFLQIPLVNGMITNAPQQQNLFNKHWLRARLTFPFSDLIIGNSKAGIIAYHAPSKKSFVVFNGFNFDRIEERSRLDCNPRNQLDIRTKYVVGMVASYSKSKDYNTFFEAAQRLLLLRNDVTFLAIGKETDSSLANSLIRNGNLDHFRLLGKKSDVESYIDIMDICVLSTFTEGISNSIMEYMAMAKPVIATEGGGTNEIVINKETGFLINKSSPDELVEKMEMLLDDEKLRTKMGLAGKVRINDFFRIDRMTNHYVLLYNRLIAK
jgi:glycosyltransferase involved in cell wall biosynthesis